MRTGNRPPVITRATVLKQKPRTPNKGRAVPAQDHWFRAPPQASKPPGDHQEISIVAANGLRSDMARTAGNLPDSCTARGK